MTKESDNAMRLAVFLEEASDFYPESSSMPNRSLCGVVAEAADLLRTQHAEIERMTSALKWEQNRAERIGTHGPGCEKWGPAHFECALQAIERLNAAVIESNLILEQAQPANLEMLEAIERKDALLRRALGFICGSRRDVNELYEAITKELQCPPHPRP